MSIQRAVKGLVLGAVVQAVVVIPATANDSLVVVGWGGTWQDAYRRAVFEPFMAETGIRIIEEEFGGEYSRVISQIDTGNVIWDLAAFESPQVIQGCEEDAFEPLDWSNLGGRDQQIDYAAHDCGIASDIWATVMAYDGDVLAEGPTSWADFWDVERFPGQRGVYRDARIVIEIALAADGVKREEIYDVLLQPDGMERAFRKLEELRPHILWIGSASETVQRLLAGDVVMTVSFNARVTGAAEENNRNLVIPWEAGFWVGTDYWVQIAGGPNPEAAQRFLAFYSRPEVQAELTKYLSYGVPTVAAYDMMSAEIRDSLPTSPDKADWAWTYSDEFWVDRQATATERFNRWASQ